jgi:hypothetical protein
MTDHIWELRNPDGGMLGMEFARGLAAATDVMLAHALPERVTVTVTDTDGTRVAHGEELAHPETTPIARLRVVGDRVERENVWPDDSDLGTPVILPGGEIGILLSWWHAEDHKAWRWRVEFSNAL